jgi:hypothetical protein
MHPVGRMKCSLTLRKVVFIRTVVVERVNKLEKKNENVHFRSINEIFSTFHLSSF